MPTVCPTFSIPTFTDVLDARRRIRPYLSPTPLRNYPALDRLVGAKVWVKHENHNPTGAFKVRGGINLVSRLSAMEREQGLYSASTGNHGQSIAYGGQLFGAHVTVFVPQNANPVKVEAMRDLGAEVVHHGPDFDSAREECERRAELERKRYVHGGNEPHLIAGVATITLEMLEERPELDVILVALGGGSDACGACIAGKTIKPKLQVIAVQSDAAPAAYRSWKERRLVQDKMESAVEGIATRVGFELPQSILWELLDDFVLVSEDDILHANYHMIEKTRNLVEGAGAAPLAAALKYADRFQGKNVGLICSGGNITPAQLATVLQAGA